VFTWFYLCHKTIVDKWPDYIFRRYQKVELQKFENASDIFYLNPTAVLRVQ